MKSKQSKTSNVPGILLSIIQIFPLVWLFNFSLLPSSALFGEKILNLKGPFTLENYLLAFKHGDIFKNLFNSIVVNGATVLLTVFLSFMISYALVRMKFKGQKIILTFIMLGIMIPIHSTILPNFMMFDKLGITDSYLALILPYTGFAIPQAVFIFSGYLDSVPIEMEEAALIDGAGLFKTVFQIIMPMMKAPIMTVSIMTFLSTWNEFIMAATFLNSGRFKTLPFSVQNFTGQYASNYSAQFAVMLLTSLPAILIYILLSDEITEGAALGAIK